MKTWQTKRRAFTLVELLVVIAIIGILFVVLISKVDFATEKSKATGVQTDFRSYQVAIETVARENAGLSVLVDADATGEEKYAELEKALNKNLDPKLHVEIDADGKISTEAKDPWKEQYLGAYLAPDEDGTVKDRGAIVIYSKGSNLKLGTTAATENGVVNVTIESGKETEGADDYSISTIYTYVNGYGEIQTATKGFSNNQNAVVGGNVTNSDPSDPGQGGGGGTQLPTENPTATLADYSWSEIQALAKAGLTAEEYKSKYGIELGQKVDDTYTLVDFNSYGGFVFMYQSGQSMSMNSTSTNAGGYVASELAPKVEALYENLDDDLKAVIKTVTIQCNDGLTYYQAGNAETATHDYTCHLFLASATEVGFDTSSMPYPDSYTAEGEAFAYFLTTNRVVVGGSSSRWWLRSAIATQAPEFWCVDENGINKWNYAFSSYAIVPTFVVG